MFGLSGFQQSSINGYPLPVISGLDGWWRGDLGVTLSSGNVTSWADQSGQGNTLSGTSGVYPTTTTIFGQTAIAFNGSQYLTFGSLSAAGGGAATYVIVYQLAATPTTGNAMTLLSIKGTSTSFAMYAVVPNVAGYTNTTFLADTSGSAVLASGYAQTLDTNKHAWIISYNGSTNTTTTNYTFNLDGSTQTVAQSSLIGRTTSDKAAIGGNVTSGNVLSNGLNGSIAEILIYNSQLSAVNITLLNTYLQVKYGV